MDFDKFVADLAARRISVWELDRLGEKLDFSPKTVAARIEQAYEARDAYLLEALLNLAVLRSHREYTPIACKILEDVSPPWGAQEAALDVLEELMDPASFDTLVRVCSRTGLKFDPTDWRKAILAISGFYRRGFCEFSVVEQALMRISESGNAVASMAVAQLKELRNQGSAL